MAPLPRSLRLGGAVLTGAMALAPEAAAQGLRSEARFVQRDDAWYREEPNGLFRVDPTVLSLRPRAQVPADWAALVPASGLEEVDLALAAMRVERLNSLGVADVRLPAGAPLFEVVDTLRASGLFDFVEVNYEGVYEGVPNDPEFFRQWNLMNSGQTGGTPDADIDAELAWDLGAGDPDIVLATLDSGAEISHDDLSGAPWTNPGEVPANGIDDDGNGWVDDVYGWDFHNDNNDVEGVHRHGTMVAGVLGARSNNGIGIAGVAGGFGNGDGCRIMVLGVGDSSPNTAVLDDAILYAIDKGARVITLSFSIVPTTPVDDALTFAYDSGVFIDASAGNDGVAGVTYPAVHPNVVSVASTGATDQVSWFSGRGPENWIAAPGENIRSTALNNDYFTNTGTSFSAPQVGGVVGLMLSQLPTLTPAEAAEVLRLTAVDVEAPGFDNETGWGRLDARAAVQHVIDADCNGNGIYDARDISDGTSLDANGNGVPDECEFERYCTAKSALVCGSPSFDWSGVPSATANAGFVVRSSPALSQRAGLVLYTDAGRLIIPFQGGFLCVQTPRRSVPVFSGGPPSSCATSFELDMNAFAQGSLGGSPQQFLRTPGTLVNAQWWGRDSVPTGSHLSDAIEYTVGP